jgi:hypothetical protein
MNPPNNNATAPDPSELGRSSHLRILTINVNTVRYPQEGPTGTRAVWSGRNGEQHQAQFEYEKADLKPEVLNGEQVEWINLTKQPCTIVFAEDECPNSPFQDGTRKFDIASGQSVLSGVISGEKNGRYPYLVSFVVPPDANGGNLGDPVLIVR